MHKTDASEVHIVQYCPNISYCFASFGLSNLQGPISGELHYSMKFIFQTYVDQTILPKSCLLAFPSVLYHAVSSLFSCLKGGSVVMCSVAIII